MKKTMLLCLAVSLNLLSNAQGFDLSQGGFYTNFDSLITGGFTATATTPLEASPYYSMVPPTINKDYTFKVNGSSVAFIHSATTEGKVSFKVYDDYIQSNGEYRTIKISKLKVGSKITMEFKPYTTDVNFEATNAEKANYSLLMATNRDSTLTILAADTCVTLVNTSGNYRLQKITITETDSVVNKLETINYLDVTKGGIYTNYRNQFIGTLAVDSAYYIAFKSTQANTDQYIGINGSPVTFHYTDTLAGGEAFKAYDTYIQPIGTNRSIKISNLKIGNEIYLSFRANQEVSFAATGAQVFNYTLLNKDTTLTVIANDSCVTLTNTAGKFKLYKIAIKGGVKMPVIPRIDYIKIDTVTYLVSDAKFQALSQRIYLESIEYLHAKIGGGDSILYHYSNYQFEPNHCTDIITINEYRSVEDTLIIRKGEFASPNEKLSIQIYPNPTKDFILIDSNNENGLSNCTLTVSNSYGQKVFVSSVNNKLQKIDLNSIGGAGLYYITFTDSKDKLISTKKLIVQ
ncbi:MAG: T9SS type A sorting domain-containing protein [Paludibacteraceae bacterium]|nr:T9SS type A sorting domain-containing protein [Paludibacteraceae bacterium]MBN2786753.1 T9SS type A sorting domain-containing protein [Paludibacteraceae bacterium]